MNTAVTNAERKAAQESDNTITTDDDVLALEELAALYVLSAGADADPRAVDLVKAAKAAGRINEAGEYIGEEPGTSSDSDEC
jgi:hypothetical protein